MNLMVFIRVWCMSEKHERRNVTFALRKNCVCVCVNFMVYEE